MTLMSIAWLCVFAVLAIQSFRRASWGIALYLLVFYVDPNFWWWGRPIAAVFGVRLSLAAALIFAVAVFRKGVQLRPHEVRLFWVLLLYALSATVVHFTAAANPEKSARGLDLLWKNVGLLFLIVTSIRDRVDWKIFVYSIVVGSLYIGYELVVNDRGNFSAGRYERAVASGVGDSNYLSGLLCLAVPLAGALLMTGDRREKILALVSLAFICDTIVLCDSRGGFLALLCGGAWLLLAAKGRARRYAMTGLLLGALAVPFLVRDQRIVDRFLTTFASTEHRDASAGSRLEFWGAAVKMFSEHPFGSGAEAAFKSELGYRYIRPLGQTHFRAVHNGYLDIACAWGVQGVALYGLALVLAWRWLYRATRQAGREGDWQAAFLGVSVQAAFIAQLVSALFLSSFDGEWFFWTIGLAIGFDRLYGLEHLASRSVARERAIAWAQLAPAHGHSQSRT